MDAQSHLDQCQGNHVAWQDTIDLNEMRLNADAAMFRNKANDLYPIAFVNWRCQSESVYNLNIPLCICKRHKQIDKISSVCCRALIAHHSNWGDEQSCRQMSVVGLRTRPYVRVVPYCTTVQYVYTRAERAAQWSAQRKMGSSLLSETTQISRQMECPKRKADELLKTNHINADKTKKKFSIKLCPSKITATSSTAAKSKAGKDDSKRRKQEKIVVKIYSASDQSYDGAIDQQGAFTEEKNSTYFDNDHAFEDEVVWEDILPCDALLAVRALVQKHQHGVVGSHNIPFVLRHVVHSVMMGNDEQDVGASTTIARELEELCHENKIRMVRLSTTDPFAGGSQAQDVAVFETDVFVSEVKRILLSNMNYIHHDERNDGRTDRAATGFDQTYDWCDLSDRFVHALGMIRDMYVRETELIQFMTSLSGTYDQRTKHTKLFDARKAIDALVFAGLLLPKRESHSLALGGPLPNAIYYFILPGMGEAGRSINNGRKEMLLRVKRSMYKEIKLTTLESTHLRTSSFSPMFHVRDLVSSGKLVLTRMPSGVFVRLVPSP